MIHSVNCGRESLKLSGVLESLGPERLERLVELNHNDK